MPCHRIKLRGAIGTGRIGVKRFAGKKSGEMDWAAVRPPWGPRLHRPLFTILRGKKLNFSLSFNGDTGSLNAGSGVLCGTATPIELLVPFPDLVVTTRAQAATPRHSRPPGGKYKGMALTKKGIYNPS